MIDLPEVISPDGLAQPPFDPTQRSHLVKFATGFVSDTMFTEESLHQLMRQCGAWCRLWLTGVEISITTRSTGYGSEPRHIVIAYVYRSHVWAKHSRWTHRLRGGHRDQRWPLNMQMLAQLILHLHYPEDFDAPTGL